MPRFVLAESNHSPMAAAIRAAIGATPGECVEVMTPEFNRPASWEPAMVPPDSRDRQAWAGFTKADRDTLRSWGCRKWSAFTTDRPVDGCAHAKAWYFDAEESGVKASHELWLFPAEWYEQIPNGFPLVDINGCLEIFEHGRTDDDRRFGLLAYGVMIPLVEE